jgi:bacteriorhodopsin
MFFVFWNVGIEGRKHAKALGNDVHRVYVSCGVLTLFLWLLYPVAWGLCEGGNVISPDAEAVFYGCLDFCAKPVFSIMLIAGHWNINPARMGLRIRDYSDPVSREKSERQNSKDESQDTAYSSGAAISS